MRSCGVLLLLLLLVVGSSRGSLTSFSNGCVLENGCDRCVFNDCAFCASSEECYDQAAFDGGEVCPDESWVLTRNECCSWSPYTTNPDVCDVVYLVELSFALLAVVLSAAFVPWIYRLGKRPWTNMMEDSNFCVFTHEPTDREAVCSRCGVEVASTRDMLGQKLCVGCYALRVSQVLLVASSVCCATALAVFFLGWGSPGVGFVMTGLVLFGVVPGLIYTLGKRELRPFCDAGEITLSEQELAMLSSLPIPFQQAIQGDMRHDERLVWVERSAPWDLFMKNFKLRSEVVIAVLFTVPFFVIAIYSEAVNGWTAVAALWTFPGVLMAVAHYPQLIPAAFACNCVYVLTNRRALLVRKGMCGGSASYSVDYRVMGELTVVYDNLGGAGGDGAGGDGAGGGGAGGGGARGGGEQGEGPSGRLSWQNDFFSAMVHVSDVDRVSRIVRREAAARTAAASAAARASGGGGRGSGEEGSSEDGWGVPGRFSDSSSTHGAESGESQESDSRRRHPHDDGGGSVGIELVSVSVGQFGETGGEAGETSGGPRGGTGGGGSGDGAAGTGTGGAGLGGLGGSNNRSTTGSGRDIDIGTAIDPDTAVATDYGRRPESPALGAAVEVERRAAEPGQRAPPNYRDLEEVHRISFYGLGAGRFILVALFVAAAIAAGVDGDLTFLLVFAGPGLLLGAIYFQIQFSWSGYVYRALQEHRYRVYDMKHGQALLVC